jgi:hypothetical protein
MAAVCLTIGCLGLTLLSSSFVYGQDQTQRPILGVLLFYSLCWIGLVLAIRQIQSGQLASVGKIVMVALVARILLLPSNLILENDVYRYVLDGQNLLHLQNPYQLSPEQIRNDPTHPLKSQLDHFLSAQVLERTSYPKISTVYPPVAQVVFAVGALLTGWDWRGQRYALLLVDLAVIGSLLILLKRLQIFPGYVIMYAWNPLVLKEVTNSAHIDVVVCLFLVLLLLSAIVFKTWTLTAVTTGFFLGLATLSKIYPIILAPIVFVWLYRRFQSLRPPLVAATTLILALVVGYLPFVGNDMRPLFEGLYIYGSQWTMNEGVFGILAQCTNYPRLMTYTGLGAFSVFCGWRLKAEGPTCLVGAMQAVLLAWLLLMPAVFPWYALSLTALACLNPRSFLSKTTVVLTLVICLYYMVFYVRYHASPDYIWALIRLFEHGSVWATLVVTLNLESRRTGAIKASFS